MLFLISFVYKSIPNALINLKIISPSLLQIPHLERRRRKAKRITKQIKHSKTKDNKN